MSDLSPVGIVGLGRMGAAIAELLIRHGYPVLGYRRSGMNDFVAAGGVAMPGAASLAARADQILLLLPTAQATLDVAAEIAPVLDEGKTLLCLATLPVADKEAVAARLGPTGATVLDAELSGTPDMLRSGTASVVVAGDRAGYDRAEPMLTTFAAAVRFAGAFGNAVKLKLLTNYLLAVHTLAAAEVLQMGRSLDLDLGLVIDWIDVSTAASRMFTVRAPIMAERRQVPGNSAAFLHYFKLLGDALRERGVAEGPLEQVTQFWFRRSAELGFSERGISGLYESLDSLFDHQKLAAP